MEIDDEFALMALFFSHLLQHFHPFLSSLQVFHNVGGEICGLCGCVDCQGEDELLEEVHIGPD